MAVLLMIVRPFVVQLPPHPAPRRQRTDIRSKIEVKGLQLLLRRAPRALENITVRSRPNP